MFRVVKISSKFFAMEIEDVIEDSENTITYIESGDVVLFCQEIEDAADALGIDEDDIEMV